MRAIQDLTAATVVSRYLYFCKYVLNVKKYFSINTSIREYSILHRGYKDHGTCVNSSSTAIFAVARSFPEDIDE